MLTLSTSGSFGQKIYASHYGYEQSGGTITHGVVENPAYATVGNYSNWTRLRVLTLLGSNEQAHYQLKFRDTLPPGTRVFIGVRANISGILGLLLTANGAVSVRQNARFTNEMAITGTELDMSQFVVDTVTINNEFFVTVTPQAQFNSVTISLTQTNMSVMGLLSLSIATLGTIDVSFAYYECPSFTATQSEPVCAGRPFTLTVSNPISTGQYQWFTDSTGGTLLFSGNPLSRTENLSGTQYYYVQHSQFSDACRRSRASVVIGNSPDNPEVDLE